MKRALAFLFLLVLAGGALAAEPVYPNYSGFVNDYAGVIDAATKQKIESLCTALEKKTSAEMAIAVVKTVEPLDSKGYAVKLFEKWKIGKKGKDNGLLILLAMDERRVEIEVGYGLEGVINDAKAGEILDKYVVPFFKQGNYGEGLYNGAAAIAEEISRSASQEMEAAYAPQPVKGGSSGGDTFFWIAMVAVIAVVMLSIFASGIASGLLGAVFGALFGFAFLGVVGAIIGAIIGFVLSYIQTPGSRWSGGGWGGGFGGGFGGGGGGFGGFGGGSSGGGGAGRSW